MPPYKFQLPGLQRAIPVGRHNETDFGGLGMGEQAEAAGAMRMVGGSADLIQGLVAQGISSGKSDRTISRSIERATALMAGKSPGSNIRVNPRSFSQQAAAGGLRENWGTQLRESTNSFFKGDQKWWNRAMVSSGVAARQQSGEAWNFADDPGLGAPNEGQWSFANDPGLGYSTMGKRPSNLPDGSVKSREDSMADEWYPEDYADTPPASREREFSMLEKMGAGGDMFEQGRKSNLDTWSTMLSSIPPFRPAGTLLTLE